MSGKAAILCVLLFQRAGCFTCRETRRYCTRREKSDRHRAELGERYWEALLSCPGGRLGVLRRHRIQHGGVSDYVRFGNAFQGRELLVPVLVQSRISLLPGSLWYGTPSVDGDSFVRERYGNMEADRYQQGSPLMRHIAPSHERG